MLASEYRKLIVHIVLPEGQDLPLMFMAGRLDRSSHLTTDASFELLHTPPSSPMAMSVTAAVCAPENEPTDSRDWLSHIEMSVSG